MSVVMNPGSSLALKILLSFEKYRASSGDLLTAYIESLHVPRRNDGWNASTVF